MSAVPGQLPASDAKRYVLEGALATARTQYVLGKLF